MHIDKQQLVSLLRARGEHVAERKSTDHTCASGACTCNDV